MAPIATVTLPNRTITKLGNTDSSNNEEQRTIKYIPIITKVDEWMSAEAGVGASIASGNQT
jgi:hypothetical protein